MESARLFDTKSYFHEQERLDMSRINKEDLNIAAPCGDEAAIGITDNHHTGAL